MSCFPGSPCCSISPHAWAPAALAEPARVTGRLLEACSCIVPCPCNFGQKPTPHKFCDSLAFFQIKDGEVSGVRLRSLRFAIAERNGFAATVYLDAGLSEKQRAAIRKLATLILALDGTPLAAVLTSPIHVEFGESRLDGSVAGAHVKLRAVPLRGNDRESPIRPKFHQELGPNSR